MWISAQHHNGHHLHHLSQTQQPYDDYARFNGQATTQLQPDVIYAVIEKDPHEGPDEDMYSDVSNIKNNDDDAVIYSNLQSTDAGSHTVAPSDDTYANLSSAF